MDGGDLLIRWTVRLALALYAAVLFGWLLTRTGRPWMRWAWTLGCALMLVHTGCAFHFVHGWSHAAAYEDTARQTGELLGVAYGGGLYWNYAFLLVWLADVVWWWAAPAGYVTRSLWVGCVVQGFLAFMAFNGAVVFAAGWVRWVGVVVCIALVAAWRVGAHLRCGAKQ